MLAVLAAATAVVAQVEVAAAYTCTVNPAICRKICGSTTCPDLSRADGNSLERLQTVQVAAGGAGTAPARKDQKTYTCSNPAICIAVCGKPTCP